MVNEKFVGLQYSPPFGGEGITARPTVVDAPAANISTTGELPTGTLLAEPSRPAVVSTHGDQLHLPPWRAAARAKGRPGYFLAKRFLDCSVALIGLIVLAVVLLVAALLIRLTSDGPVIFRQKRVGFRGRHFVMYKFRSMYVNSDERLHQLAYEQFLRGERSHGKVDGELVADGKPQVNRKQDESGSALEALKPNAPRDPRITPLGRLLRSTSIDELPQLVNVLRGDMSLVGPRPPIPYEVGLYESWHLGRLDALPGITGIWQVRGRSRVSFEEMVQMDLDYIQKQSFWYDVKVLWLTIPAVLSRKGAE